MRKIAVVFFSFLWLQGCSQSGILGVLKPKVAPESFAELEAILPSATRYAGNPIIPYGAGWAARQVHFPYVIEDPFNSDSLIMFYGGGTKDIPYYSIGRAMASKANPYVWVEYAGNPIFQPSDYADIGLIVGVQDARWNPYEQRFELIASTWTTDFGSAWPGKYYSDDGFTFTYEGPLIMPSGDESMVGDGGMLRDGATWYFAYTYRTAVTLPGVRIASSTDSGATWTKHGDFINTGTPPGTYDDKYIEGVQFLKIGSDYILNYGAARYNGGEPVYSGALASSSSPLGTYTKSSINPFFEHSDSDWDSTQVSTIVIFNVVEPWLIFYQGANTPGLYTGAFWSIGVAKLWE